MARVGLWGSLTQYTGGQSHVEIPARNVRQMLDGLAEQYPGLKPHLDRGVAVSINGQIYRDAWFQPIPEGAEVFLLPKLAGG
jgi:molybdopterin converting factor small subunit